MARQLEILSYTPPELHGSREGETYDEKRDRKRLDTQADRVFIVMSDGQEHTLRELAEKCQGGGTWVYRLAGRAV